MIDSTRLGLLLRALTRTENGLAPHDVTQQVPRLPGLAPTSRETRSQVLPEILARGASGEPGRAEAEPEARRANDPAARQASDGSERQAGEGSGHRASEGSARQASDSFVRQASDSAARTVSAGSRQAVAGATLTQAPASGHDDNASIDLGRGSRSIALTLSDTAQLLAAVLRDVEIPSATGQRVAAPIPGAPPSAGAPPASAQAPKESMRDASPTAVLRARALVSLPPDVVPARERFAAALQHAVEYSGLFYESHVAQWAQGDRSTARLAREPQAHWPQAVDADALIAQGGASAGADAPAPVLRQQLDMLESNRFVWTGELWPGQRGSLSIEEDPEHPEQSGPGWTGPRAWRTRVRLQLPRLGDVEASLALRGTGVALTLHCADGDSARRLAAATPALRVAIMQRGLDVTQLVIGDDASS